MQKEMYQTETAGGRNDIGPSSNSHPYKRSCEVIEIEFEILNNSDNNNSNNNNNNTGSKGGRISESISATHRNSSSSQSTNPAMMSSNPMNWKDSYSNAGLLPRVGARICSNCMTSQTPLWRSGPYGPKSLCNACGIRYRKETGLRIVSGLMPPSIKPKTSS